ncbi:protein phosphatase 2C domain-containing protein [Parahaliea maris]|uniref:protein phosphatase 2C domain-containing protein n=1 Tax=Parahaliea maris TaxID=2716870 RepID=UPI00165021F4|nr:protein phosphatase 2C domain-containing protein [Parahaliea maris]
MSALEVVAEGSGASHVGQRKHNEDAYLLDAPQSLAVVADGVGGHQAGEVASAITCEVIQREVNAGRSIEDGIRAANREVMAAVAQGRGKAGMASTVVVARFSDSDFELAWVGDSRAYLWDGQLKLLTRDHSYVQALLAKGQITLAQARNHPRKNVIVQAIGLQEDDKLEVGINCGRLSPGQVLLLCSDGLSDVLDSSVMSEILGSDRPLRDRCETLVETAVRAGGRDNITVIVLPGVAAHSEAGLLEPEVLWTFDPATGEYSGLPELEAVDENATPIPIPAVRRVVARKGGAEAPTQPESTQMMSATEIAAAREAMQREKDSRRNRTIFWIVAAVLVAGSVVYSLGIIASG